MQEPVDPAIRTTQLWDCILEREIFDGDLIRGGH
jgi:hypothetical protein